MTWAQVFNQLDSWTVAGVTVVNFGAVQERFGAADCPVMFPVFAEFAGSRGAAQGFTANKGQDVFVFDHTLLYKPLGLGKYSEVIPSLISLYDLYWATAMADPTAGNYLSQKLELSEKFWPKISWGGITYWGFAVRWKATLRV